MHIASNGLRGHGSLQTTSKVTSDLGMALSDLMTASETMVASKWPRRSYDLRFDISNLDYPGIHVHIASNSLQGHGGPQMTSEVTSDLKIQLSDLDYLCYHVSLASIASFHLILPGGGQTWPIDLRGFAAGKNKESKGKEA